MAKSKKTKTKGRRRASAKKVVRRSAKSVQHLGFDLGVAETVAEMLFERPVGNAAGAGSVIETMFPPKGTQRSIAESAKIAINVVRDNASNLGHYKGLAVGTAASVSTKVPVLRVIAKPLDRMVRDVTKGKMGL